MAINWQSLIGIDRIRESARFWVEEGSYAAHDRLELAKLEWAAHRRALFKALVAVVVLLYFAFGFLFLGSIIVLMHWWDTPDWMTAVLSVLAFWGGISLVALLVVLSVRKRLAAPFALTRKVLAADLHDLKERL